MTFPSARSGRERRQRCHERKSSSASIPASTTRCATSPVSSTWAARRPSQATPAPPAERTPPSAPNLTLPRRYARLLPARQRKERPAPLGWLRPARPARRRLATRARAASMFACGEKPKDPARRRGIGGQSHLLAKKKNTHAVLQLSCERFKSSAWAGSWAWRPGPSGHVGKTTQETKERRNDV